MNAPTATILDCQSGFIHKLKWLSIDRSNCQSVATIDHFPHLRRSRPCCIERSLTARQFYWMVGFAVPPSQKNVSEQSLALRRRNLRPLILFRVSVSTAYRASKATRRDDRYRGGWNCLLWPSIVAPIAYAFCLVFTLSVLGLSTSFVRR
jgi:hypothetical protein